MKILQKYKDAKVPILGFGFLVIAYVLGRPIALPDFDAGEFLAIAIQGGIAHPPGYPLLSAIYRLIGRFELGPDQLILVLSHLSILLTLYALVFQYYIARFVGADRFASTAAVVAVGLSAPVWRNATAIEPFALNMFTSSLFVYALCHVLFRAENNRQSSVALWVAGLSMGLAFCNHHSQAFLLPLLIVVLVCKWRSAPTYGKDLGTFFFGAVCGLLPLLYFFMANTNAPAVWGDWSNIWVRLPVHLFRLEYGMLSLVKGAAGPLYTGPYQFFLTFFIGLSFIFAWAVLIGIGLIKQTRGHARTILAMTLLAILCLVGLYFPLFRIEWTAEDRNMIMRFFDIPLLMMVPLLAVGIGLLEKTIPRLAIPVVVLAILFHASSQWDAAERRSETFYDDHVQNIFSSVERNAVLITANDADLMGMLYGNAIYFPEAQVDYIHAGFMQFPWYQQRLAVKLDLPVEATNVIDHAMKTRPVYTIAAGDNMPQHYLEHAYPIGPLIRLVPKSEKLPTAVALLQENFVLYDQFLILPSPEQVAEMKLWERDLLPKYERPWQSLLTVLKREGDSENLLKARDYSTMIGLPFPQLHD